MPTASTARSVKSSPRPPVATRAASPVRKAMSAAAPRLARVAARTGVASPLESIAVVTAATGRSWAQWFRLLDRMGVARLDVLARRLADEYDCPRWWRQRIVTAHAEARGLQTPQRPALSANSSRTLAVSVEDLWRAWQGRAPAKWLHGKFKVQRANENRSMRLTWPDHTIVEVYFWAKGASRSQVNVMHRQLADAADVAAKKTFWLDALERLRIALE